MPRQCACAVLAVLISLLAFAGMLQGMRAWWQGQGGSRADAGGLLAVRLLAKGDAETSFAHVHAAALPPRDNAVAGLTHEAVQKSIQERIQDPVEESMEQSFNEPAHADSGTPASDAFSVTAGGTISETTSETISEAMTPTAGYVPAAELSERPVLLQDLDPVLALPASAAASADPAGTADITGLSTAIGILLINQQGSVDRLLFETPGYPRYLEDMLALRFADVRFRPGKIDGKPVPSALRIIMQLQ